MNKKITVIGCGVSGLTSGICLLEAGFDVTIIARNLPPNTTSDTAAAIWYPYRCYPENKVLEWGKITLGRFDKLIDNPETGIFPITFTEYVPEISTDPWWASAVQNFRRITSNKIPSIYKESYQFEVPFIDTSLYMPWLMNRFKELGGKIKQQEIVSFDSVKEDGSLIINCSGIGARKLADDEKIYPVRGQTIRAKGENDGGYYLDQLGELALCYIFPRKNDIVLGGTALEHDYRTESDELLTNQILQKVKKLDPSLRITEILEVKVGLRPARFEVRLEMEKPENQKAIIHNYGHGGAGFTLSWGCAEDVVKIANKYIKSL